MAECPMCGCGDYENTDGFYFCAACGTQSQVALEERKQSDASIVSISSLFRILGKKEKRNQREL